MRTAILVAVLSLPLLAQLPDGASLEIRVQEVAGEVDYQTAPKTAWKAAQVGDVLPVGTKLCTGVEGLVVLAFGTNSVAILKPTSLLDIVAYGMEGDQLVAKVKIDPGVCTVSVKQLAQFQTDFQVSTPRLTASVRGSIQEVIANGGRYDLLDLVRCIEDASFIEFLNGMMNTVGQGGGVTSGNLNVDQNALGANIIAVVSGLANNELGADQQNVVSQSTVIDAGSQTGFSNPVSNVVGPPPPPPTQDLTINLSWLAPGDDFDLHYLTQAYHVSYSAPVSPDGSVALGGDDTDSPGFESLFIRGPQPPNTDALVYVHNYDFNSGTGTIANAGTQLTVQDNTGAVNQTFNVDPGAPDKEYWAVFGIQYGPNSQVSIVPVDVHTNTDPAGE